MILYGSIKQMWTVFPLNNVISPCFVNDTTNETEKFSKNIKGNAKF